MCQVPMHYASFKQMLGLVFRGKDAARLPLSPLILDLGCGPATTLFALDFYEERGMVLEASYFGIDSSGILTKLGKRMAAGRVDSDTAFFESMAALGDDDLARAAERCSGVVFALSYVLHQEFLADMSILAELMLKVRAVTPDFPTWFLLQDANYADHPEKYTDVWPEDRLNMLSDKCADFGYKIRARRSDKVTFQAPRVRVLEGRLHVGELGETGNVCGFAQRIA